MERTYHYASKIRPDGAVSALCYSKPRAIDLSRASWTNRRSDVTCKKCKALLQAQHQAEVRDSVRHGPGSS